ncbi:MAG: sigma 54-interacting transcriptional regulator [Candidatus Poribacteria bacterium]|nr:sigma 54-interacting transcriptional regulator [Candidatus Poribacteria bacterium]
MAEWIQVAQTSEIEPGKSKVIKLGGESVAVFNAGGKFYATANTCPHQGGPLGEGDLDGEVVTCPWHGWKYDLKTGCPLVTPAVKTYALRTDGEMIQIAVEPDVRARGQQDDITFEVKGETDPVYEILEQINLGKTLDEVFENIYAGLQEVVPHNRLGIALIDELSGKLVQVKTKSDRKIVLDNGFSARIAGSSLERILELGEARIIDDLQEHLAKTPSNWTRLIVEEGMRSSLTLPLKVGGRPIGVVFFTSVSPGAFSEAHVGFLKQIAGQLSILIEKGRWVSELAQSNERYRTLFEMSNDAIFICPSPSQTFLTVNENMCTWLGYTHQELSNLSLRDLMHPDEFQRVSQFLDKLSDQTDPVTFETELPKRDGELLPLGMRVVRIEHGGQQFIQGFARDLSEVKALSEQLKLRHSFEKLIGKNREMQEVYELIQQVALMSTTVLIQGESGTGKELVAQAIHHRSPRKDRAFVTVNCGALVENLLESELFGHVRGAFTGATATRPGRFEMADSGTIFLDEVADLSPATQVKLLRVLQEGEFEKVGSATTQKVDVRVIAATNRDLKAAIEAGSFREDLYYRLNVVPIVLPPLRERRDDIPLLIQHFIRKFNRQNRKSIGDVLPEVLELLMEYSYPGNVRQLENIIEHAFVKCSGDTIETKHLPAELTAAKDDILTLAFMAEKPLATLERELIKKVLAQCDGKPKLAAKRLGISRTTLWRRLREEEVLEV